MDVRSRAVHGVHGRCRMKVLSYIRQGHQLAPVEVELSLTQGLPQISFLGLPDTALKESVLRIRSALREQGFQLPQAHQVLVHLRPSHLRKSSRGLDLAVAAALLWETGQIPLPSESVDLSSLTKPPVLYGELTLKGEVIRPDDIEDVEPGPDQILITGGGPELFGFPSLQVRRLQELAHPTWVPAAETIERWTRPAPSVKAFAPAAAELAMIVATGEHAALFAGPPGSGKSTLAEAIPAFLAEPDPVEFRIAKRLARAVGRGLSWRPVCQPHHSVTPLAMIGGGSSLWPGEISRAHGGVLILDELLEFHSEIQEALREPVESGSISIARAGAVRTFPARLLLLATTNLCPCGRYSPRREFSRCRCTRRERLKSIARLSGPFVDRFAIFALTDEWGESGGAGDVGGGNGGEKDGDITCEAITERVRAAIDFRVRTRAQRVANARLDPDVIEGALSLFQRTELLGAAGGSRRRKAAVLRVARTIADLRGSQAIEHRDLERAVFHCLRAHRCLEQAMD